MLRFAPPLMIIYNKSSLYVTFVVVFTLGNIMTCSLFRTLDKAVYSWPWEKAALLTSKPVRSSVKP